MVGTKGWTSADALHHRVRQHHGRLRGRSKLLYVDRSEMAYQGRENGGHKAVDLLFTDLSM